MYKNHESVKNYVCYYCSAGADSLDHFPSQHRRFDFGVEKIRVRCCRECNDFLGHSCQKNLAERKKFALARFERKYQKITDRENFEIQEVKDEQ